MGEYVPRERKRMSELKLLEKQPIEIQKEQYDEKNAVLDQFGEWVDAWTLYEDIYPNMDMLMPVIIIDEEEQKHVLKMTVEEAIDRCKGHNDVLMGGASYFNEFVSKTTAKEIYAFIIDMDNVYSGTLIRALQHDWKTENGEEIPFPTYIVNSGTGLHLYFVLDRPLPCYKSQLGNIDQLYRRLAELETTKRVYLRKSVQWFGQDFRMAGGNGKKGWENTVFKVGDKWDVDELGRAVGLENVHFIHEGEAKPREKEKLQKDHKRKAKPRRGYYLNRAVYDSSLKRCREETFEGNRYTSMCALSVLAWKCKVPQDELEADLLDLLPVYNKRSDSKVKKKEIYSAMKMYNEKAIDTPKVRTEEWLGWKFKGSKRNGQKQAEHLEEARAIRDIRSKRRGEAWDAHNGRKPKKEAVEEWRLAHPDGTKAECHRETGLSRPTIDKWWGDMESIERENLQKQADELIFTESEMTPEFMMALAEKGIRRVKVVPDEEYQVELMKQWIDKGMP